MKLREVALACLIISRLTPLLAGDHVGVQRASSVKPVRTPLSTNLPNLDETPPPRYMQETMVPFLPISVECLWALVFLLCLGSVPLVIAGLKGIDRLTKADIVESCGWTLSLVFVISLFKFVEFNSSAGHWEGARTLTIVESVYLLAQMLTTVGYGDITPKSAITQVWVAFGAMLVIFFLTAVLVDAGDFLDRRRKKEEYLVSPRSWSLRQQKKGVRKVHSKQLRHSLLFFGIMVTIGILFWHYYPGEEKTWMQAVYFSVITLSTVGFGAITATTPGGMIFGAFWMTLGVAAMAAVVTAFVQVMVDMKAVQRESKDRHNVCFLETAELFARDVGGDDRCMDSYDFLKFCVVSEDMATLEEIKHMEERWAFLCQGQEQICQFELEMAEAPPNWEFLREQDRTSELMMRVHERGHEMRMKTLPDRQGSATD